jgi:hypothetical protein
LVAHAPPQDCPYVSDPPRFSGALWQAICAGWGELTEETVLLSHPYRIAPVIDAARTVKRYWDGILQWFDSEIANGLIVGINSLVQVAKAKARGYRSTCKPQAHHPPAGRQARPTTARARTILPTLTGEEPTKIRHPNERPEVGRPN